MQRNYYIIYFLICLYVLWPGKKGPLRGPGSEGSEGSEGGGGGFATDFEEKGRGSAAGCVEGLCSLRSGGDGPSGRG